MQRRRQEQLLRRPVRTMVVLGVLFGVVMTLFSLLVDGGSAIAAVAGGFVGGAVFGPLMVRVTERRSS